MAKLVDLVGWLEVAARKQIRKKHFFTIFSSYWAAIGKTGFIPVLRLVT